MGRHLPPPGHHPPPLPPDLSPSRRRARTRSSPSSPTTKGRGLDPTATSVRRETRSLSDTLLAGTASSSSTQRRSCLSLYSKHLPFFSQHPFMSIQKNKDVQKNNKKK